MEVAFDAPMSQLELLCMPLVNPRDSLAASAPASLTPSTGSMQLVGEHQLRLAASGDLGQIAGEPKPSVPRVL